MNDEMSGFLQHLYRQCPANAGFATLTAIHPTEHLPAPSVHVARINHDGLVQSLSWIDRQNKAGWGAYIAVGLRSANLGRWRRGGRGDVCLIPALYADLDSSDAQTWETVQRFPFEPSIIVSSGKGIHLYWILETPTVRFAVVNDLLRQLGRQLGGDVLSTAQSLRLPGTRNTKPGRHNALCYVLEQNLNLYRLDTFIEYDSKPFDSAPAHSPLYALPLTKRTSHATIDQQRASTVTSILLEQYGGYLKLGSRWVAALCPFGHTRDHPGSHFYFAPDIGFARCFGRHGVIPFETLCQILHIDAKTALATHSSSVPS